jgi:hypothetical protein
MMKHMLWWSFPGFPRSFYPVVVVSFLALSSFAQPASNRTSDPVTNQTPRERLRLAESFTAERLWVWQKRLNLQDWNISVIMSRTSDLKPKTLGNIHWDADKKTAVIRVLDPADYKMPFNEMLADMEFTVVHELIHLELSSLPRSDASRRDEEHAVNQIADALLKLDRK